MADDRYTAEQSARKEIDRQLEACGWVLQNSDAVNLARHLRRRPLRRAFLRGPT